MTHLQIFLKSSMNDIKNKVQVDKSKKKKQSLSIENIVSNLKQTIHQAYIPSSNNENGLIGESSDIKEENCKVCGKSFLKGDTTREDDRSYESFCCNECTDLTEEITVIQQEAPRIHSFAPEIPFIPSEIPLITPEVPLVCNNQLDSGINESVKTLSIEICRKCGEPFTLKQSFESRIGVGAFLVSECGNCFAKKRQLQESYELPRPFVCDVCSKSFARKSDFERHQDIHTGIKKFHCDDCGKSFHRNSNLKRHKQTHLVTKEYKCSVCKGNFTRKKYLENHEREKHKFLTL
eukprot:TCONS_00042780-protein